MKPTLLLDFDGVIHAYTSGWQGATAIPDGMVPGFWEWAEKAAEHFDLAIYSSRSKEPGGIEAMQAWLTEQRRQWREAGGAALADGPLAIGFVTHKPAAFLTLDDRCICFDGTWPDPAVLRDFKPWNTCRPAVEVAPGKPAPD